MRTPLKAVNWFKFINSTHEFKTELIPCSSAQVPLSQVTCWVRQGWGFPDSWQVLGMVWKQGYGWQISITPILPLAHMPHEYMSLKPLASSLAFNRISPFIFSFMPCVQRSIQRQKIAKIIRTDREISVIQSMLTATLLAWASRMAAVTLLDSSWSLEVIYNSCERIPIWHNPQI